MILFPAIDLYRGSVIRLSKGEFDKMTTYGNNPYDTARMFADAGGRHIHIVDLEGAEVGYPKHLDILSKIGGLGMFVQYGGGLRTKRAIKDAIRAGANNVMVGSLLFKTKEMAFELYEEFGDSILPSIDVKEGRVAISGWQEMTDTVPSACLEFLQGIGFKKFLVTSVERDGTMKGPDLELYRDLVSPGASIIAAGGVAGIGDIEKLASEGLHGAVVGKALYEGTLDFKAALSAAAAGKS